MPSSRPGRDRACGCHEVLTKAGGVEVPYQVGTMIEVPRAAITADEIAETAIL